MTTFRYENTTPERFQEFCQSLFLPDFPGLHCYPIGQPDGGRDGVALNSEVLTILQVKFKRKDENVDDTAAWLISSLAGEVEKVKRLKERGARHYVIISNASASSHLDVGQRDRVDQWLTTNMPLPSDCYWRDDLDRRYERAEQLKWRFTEFLDGPDAVRMLFESGITEDRTRRAVAIRSFVSSQFESESQVKFKQVELKNDLFALFVDVPAWPQARQRKAVKEQEALHWLMSIELPSNTDKDRPESVDLEHLRHGARRAPGAARLLLDERLQAQFPKVVIEGAPGQGKSTLAQYICQVHRVRFLEHEDAIDALPADHRSSPLRIPIKVDLRDLATWLDRNDPFDPLQKDVPNDWSASLESFLSALIRTNSGGIRFETFDLLASLGRAPIILFLDGLDEVATIAKRRTLIDAVASGLKRFDSNGLNVQVVATSRPAAFANSPGFPDELFSYWYLGDLPLQLVLDYSEKWLMARELDASDAKDVRQILKAKLDLPHIRDLSRNPMQLAILLSLIHSIGFSLPDKRTAMYDAYMEKFLAREAEKSLAVREHRDLLVRLHRFLAWLLQSQAEAGRTSGGITTKELREVLSSYLAQSGHGQDILDDLFTGMVERVFVLVQRVGGSYEFDVQPIREYFAAKHLYETAPYSPAGRVRSGTKPQRFAALAGNRYWTNVTRFYAGCYSSGELADLLVHLEDLNAGTAVAPMLHVRELGAMLLTDWVFTQNPNIERRVVKTVFDPIGIRGAARGYEQRGGLFGALPVTLPTSTSRQSLNDIILEELGVVYSPDSTQDLCRLMAKNLDPTLEAKFLDRLEQSEGMLQTRWFDFAMRGGVLSEARREMALELVRRDPEQEAVRALITMRNRPEWLESDSELYVSVVESLVAERLPLRSYLGHQTHSLSVFATLCDIWQYGAFLRFEDQTVNALIMSEKVSRPTKSCDPRVEVLLSAVRSLDWRSAKWHTSLDPWEAVVENFRRAFGETWIGYRIACISAGIVDRSEKGELGDGLFDPSTGLTRRARAARMKRGSSKLWMSWLNDAGDGCDERAFWALMGIAWGGRAILDLYSEIRRVVDDLDEQRFRSMYETVDTLGSSSIKVGAEAVDIGVDELGVRTYGLLVARYALEPSAEALGMLAQSRQPVLVELANSALIDQSMKSGSFLSGRNWRKQLEMIRGGYMAGGVNQGKWMHGMNRRIEMSANAAELILESPWDYPYLLIARAAQSRQSGSATETVGDLAKKEGWSFE